MRQRSYRFDASEHRLIVEALTSYITTLDSFLADAEGDDVDLPREDRATCRALVEKLGGRGI